MVCDTIAVLKRRGTSTMITTDKARGLTMQHCEAMKESTHNVYQIINRDSAKLKRWSDILEDFDAFINEFGGCAREESDDPARWDVFHKMYLVGFVFRSLNDTTIEVDYLTEILLAEYDSDGDPVMRYAKTWFAIPRTVKQAARKLTQMLRRYADLIERGIITPEYGIEPEEVDELIDFVKSNLEIEE